MSIGDSENAAETETGKAGGDPIAALILDMTAASGAITPKAVAEAYFALHRKKRDKDDGWRRYMTPIRQQAVNLARKGAIVILRRGQPADPEDFRGLYKIARP